VYAPIYPQVTLAALFGGGFTAEALQTAYIGVLSAWQDYLANFNHGRGVVLIGHSQGSGMLIQLLKEQFDPKPALRRQLVSAVLLGGDVEVPIGQTVGGSFEHVPACQFAWQTGCLVAYSSFLKEPPSGALFGRAENASNEVVCVNPTLLVQGKHAGPLVAYASTTPFPGPLAPFVQVPGAVLGPVRASRRSHVAAGDPCGPIRRSAGTSQRNPRTAVGDAPRRREPRAWQPRRSRWGPVAGLPVGESLLRALWCGRGRRS
jgi:hypothetical protein